MRIELVSLICGAVIVICTLIICCTYHNTHTVSSYGNFSHSEPISEQ